MSTSTTVTTISGRAARRGPVPITDRGEPTFALMSIDEYRRLGGGGAPPRTLLAVMDSLPAAPDIDFEPARIAGRPVRDAALD